MHEKGNEPFSREITLLTHEATIWSDFQLYDQNVQSVLQRIGMPDNVNITVVGATEDYKGKELISFGPSTVSDDTTAHYLPVLPNKNSLENLDPAAQDTKILALERKAIEGLMDIVMYHETEPKMDARLHKMIRNSTYRWLGTLAASSIWIGEKVNDTGDAVTATPIVAATAFLVHSRRNQVKQRLGAVKVAEIEKIKDIRSGHIERILKEEGPLMGPRLNHDPHNFQS